MNTIRQLIKELLLEEALSSLELSQRLSIPEKEVLDHLTTSPGPQGRAAGFK